MNQHITSPTTGNDIHLQLVSAKGCTGFDFFQMWPGLDLEYLAGFGIANPTGARAEAGNDLF